MDLRAKVYPQSDACVYFVLYHDDPKWLCAQSNLWTPYTISEVSEPTPIAKCLSGVASIETPPHPLHIWSATDDIT